MLTKKLLLPAAALLLAACGNTASPSAPTPAQAQGQVQAAPTAIAATSQPRAALPPYLARAHSHNDYEQRYPLQTALEYGFSSVEADIHLVDGVLRIGHGLALDPNRTLESLYLKPLRERVQRGGGWVYRPGEVLTLYVDVKTDTAATYWALEALLAEYADILVSVKNGQVRSGAVQVIVTGNRDRELARNLSPRYSFQDGTLNDLYRPHEPLSLIPSVNAKWSDEFSWWGWFEMSETERKKLRELGAASQASGRALRFWAAPQTERAYRELYSAGVNRINTDNIPALAEFLRGQ